MAGMSARGAVAASIDRLPPILPLLALGVAAVFAALLGPEALTVAVFGLGGMILVALRPQWGVATLLVMLMVQYGSRRYEREGVAGIASLITAGSGLITVNNMLGLFLALLLVYHVYRDGDWSFLRNRQVQLVAAITAVLAFSGFVSEIAAGDAIQLGVRLSGGQDPSRLLVSRALFLVLFVFFVRKPQDLRMIVWLFVALVLLTAWSGASAGLAGTGRAEVADYRAGGMEVLIQSTQNPNRLAMISTLAMIFIWEFSQAHALRRWRWASGAAILMLVLTVFLSASRGGVLVLGFTALLLFSRRRAGGSRLLFGIAVVVLATLLIGQVVPEQILERIANVPGLGGESGGEGSGSAERRAYTYGVAFDVWQQGPLVGVGPGNWPYVRFMTDPLRSAAAPHNSFLKALAEGGLITLALYVVLFIVTLRALVSCERAPAAMARAGKDGLAWLVPATRIALSSFLVFSFFGDLWDLIFSYLLFGIAAVLIQRYGPFVDQPAPEPA